MQDYDSNNEFDSVALDDDGSIESADDVVANISRSIGDSQACRGNRLRIGLLMANVLLFLASALLLVYTNRGSNASADPLVKIGLSGCIQVIYISPLLCASLLAALGPGRAWIRGGLYFAVVCVGSVVLDLLDAYFGPPPRSLAAIFADYGQTVLGWLVVMVPAIFCLALIGSWLRLRIGPVELPGVRITIQSVMIATAILGLVVSLTIASNEAFYRRMAQGGTAESMVEANRLQVLTQAAVAGPVIGLLLACLVTAAYRWWARLALLFLVGMYGGMACYFMTQSAPQFPSSQVNVLLILYGGMIIGILATCIWVMICTRLLHRSGWPYSRR